MFQKPVKKTSDIIKQKNQPQIEQHDEPKAEKEVYQTVIHPQTIIVKNKTGINPFFPLKVILEIGRWAIILVLLAMIVIALMAVLHELYPAKFPFMNEVIAVLSNSAEKIWMLINNK